MNLWRKKDWPLRIRQQIQLVVLVWFFFFCFFDKIVLVWFYSHIDDYFNEWLNMGTLFSMWYEPTIVCHSDSFSLISLFLNLFYQLFEYIMFMLKILHLMPLKRTNVHCPGSCWRSFMKNIQIFGLTFFDYKCFDI